MPKIFLRCDENDPHSIAEECRKIASTPVREIPSVRYIQKLLEAAAAHLDKPAAKKGRRSPNHELGAGDAAA